MEDRVLMRVVQRITNEQEQSQAPLHLQSIRVGEPRDRLASHVFHHDVRSCVHGDSGIEDARDVRVAHALERPTLRLESRGGAERREPGLHHLQRDDPLQWLALLREVDDAHGALADAVADPIRSDTGAGHQASARRVRRSAGPRDRRRRGVVPQE
jgi:hypothetical protein